MIASVIVDVLNANVDRVFDYMVPEALQIVPGERVSVPFGGRNVEGFVVECKESSEYLGALKGIREKLDDCPALTTENLALARYLARECHILLAESLRLFIPAEMRGGRVFAKVAKCVKRCSGLVLEEAESSLRKGAKRQVEALRYLFSHDEESLSRLSELFSASSIHALAEKGFVVIFEQSQGRRPYNTIADQIKNVTLNYAQQQVVETIAKNESGRYLIHGVTGSGKTEVYIACIKRTLALGKTAIMLVPEIGLTPQVLKRFRGEFGSQVAILHSGLSSGERYDEWWRLRHGEAKVVVGARSAVFAPLEHVGMIIIDEEHEQSYNSESSPRYSTITVAEFRAAYNHAGLVLGSATPLVESYYRAKNGEYRLLELSERAGNAQMPEVQVVDMRTEVSRGNNTIFSAELVESLREVLERGEQAMLFINRRGYSPVVVCSDCGYVARCQDCDVSLTYHRDEELLKCHYCGARYQMLTQCPKCGGAHIRMSGQGTQRVTVDLQALFPNARILRMDNDTTRNKEGHLKITEKFGAGDADFLVGTQMIAKGHDFKNVTLVGILDADLSLYFADYRAGERTFSLITQVAGRAGRASKTGRVILQTHTPWNYILQLAKSYDYTGFYDREIALRETAKFPPFASILRVMVISDTDDGALSALKACFEGLQLLKSQYSDSFLFLNKMKSPVKMIMKKYRYQALMRVTGTCTKSIIQAIYSLLDGLQTKQTSLYLEINPSSMY